MTTSTFTLDTSGYVDVIALGIFKLPGHLHAQTTVQWSDLSPFTQGYIEALFASDHEELDAMEPDAGLGRREGKWLGFSDLAPETLARIIADCEAAEKSVPSTYSGKQRGSQFWHIRADGIYPNFPPLTVILGDDGKVRFAA